MIAWLPIGREAVLAAFAANAEDAFLEVQVGHLEFDQFADADAAGVEDLEHGLVAGGEKVGVAGGVEQLLDLLEVHALGQALFLLGSADGGERIDADHAAADQELVEAAERRQLPGGRALGVVLPVEVGEELADGQGLALELPLVELLARELIGASASAPSWQWPIWPERNWPNWIRSAP